jgi:hypothetical protein
MGKLYYKLNAYFYKRRELYTRLIIIVYDYINALL